MTAGTDETQSPEPQADEDRAGGEGRKRGQGSGEAPESAEPQEPSQPEKAGPESPEPEDTGPLGAGEHVVQPGECILSIAESAGLFWETVWNHPDNAELKQKRAGPHLLRPGDRITVPEMTRKDESAATEKKHRFKRKGVPAKFRVKILDMERKPRKSLDYVLWIDGDQKKGKTDQDGCVEKSIPPGAKQAVLEFDEDGTKVRYEFALGNLFPVSEWMGVQQRLQNLGYYSGEINGEPSPELKTAIAAFQSHAEIEPSGRADEATRNKLKELHGC